MSEYPFVQLTVATKPAPGDANSLPHEDTYTIQYRERGDGTAILLLHELGLCCDAWCAQLSYLADSYRVIAPSLPGHGGSSPLPEHASLEDFAAIMSALLGELGVQSYHLVGHGFGAMIARTMAAREGSRAVSLTEIGGDSVALSALARLPDDQRQAATGIADLVRNWLGGELVGTDEALAHWMETMLLRGDLLHFRSIARRVGEWQNSIAYAAAAVSVPTCRIAGEKIGAAHSAPDENTRIVYGHAHALPITGFTTVNSIIRSCIRHSEEQSALAANPNADSGGAAVEGSPSNHTAAIQHAGGLNLRQLRDALGNYLTGVTIVTTHDSTAEQPHGFTANSFTSVSLDPPLVSVCIGHQGRSYKTFENASHFAINVLSQEQKPLAVLFSSPVPGRFDANAWQTQGAHSPVLPDALAWFDCERYQSMPAGDHLLLIGKVLRMSHRANSPLGFHRGSYINLGIDTDTLRTRDLVMVGALLDYRGDVLLIRHPKQGLTLPIGHGLGSSENPQSLLGELATLGVKVSLGPIFSVYDNLVDEEDEGKSRSMIFYRGELADLPSRRAGFELIGENEIPWDEVGDSAVRSMLKRFVEERKQNRFGVYFGDRDRGTVHRGAAHGKP